MQTDQYGLAKETLMEAFSKAADRLKQRKPFVLFRKPGAKLLTGIFQNAGTLSDINDFTQSGFVLAPFDRGKTWILKDSDCERMTVAYDPISRHTAVHEPSVNADARRDFEALVAKGISAIANGLFQKVVLSRTESMQLGNFDPFAAFEVLCATYPTAFVYIWFHPETDIWMAATPEKLLQANGTRFETMALAGTQRFEGEESVEWAHKEREEQRFVTDFIWNSLEAAVDEIELGAPYTYRAGNLLHIRTDIKGTLRDARDLSQVIAALHPTPAVCGLPKQEAREFIVANEGYDREYYAGFIGELNIEGQTDLYVNLRCMKIRDSAAQLFIGCGVTAESDPEKEFFETVHKSLTVKKALGSE